MVTTQVKVAPLLHRLPHDCVQLIIGHAAAMTIQTCWRHHDSMPALCECDGHDRGALHVHGIFPLLIDELPMCSEYVTTVIADRLQCLLLDVIHE